jgi:LuxR family maltose regulon positive regulatory protein
VALGPRAEQWIVTVAAIADLSLIAGMRGRRAEQLRLADEAAGLARERGLLDSVEVGRCTRHAASRWPPLGHPEAALPELEQGVLLRRLWGQQLDVVDGLVALAPATAATGDRARAAELLDEAEAILAGCPARFPAGSPRQGGRPGPAPHGPGRASPIASSRCCAC